MIPINRIFFQVTTIFYRNSEIRKKVIFFLSMFILISGTCLFASAYAVVPFAITPEERKMLPHYCRGGKFGVPVHYSNHLCYGLNFINRADKTLKNGTDKQFYLAKAVGEFQAVISHTQKKNTDGRYNTYLSVVSRYQAEVFERQQKFGEAIRAYEQSIRYHPKQSKAYSQLSDMFKRRGMTKEAREILERGLKQMPNSKSLKRRLNRLSSK